MRTQIDGDAMIGTFKVTIDGWRNGEAIPPRFAFCAPSRDGRATLGENLSPAIRWSEVPTRTRSLAVICHDPDVPSVGDDVNKEGRTISSSLPRVDFFHWVLVDIPAAVTGLAEGAESRGVTAHGKKPGKCEFGMRGINNYTEWFASDADMIGEYGGYDGPCPPWNDEIVHHYHFAVHALDIPSLGLSGIFGARDALAAMQGHVLATGAWVGTYVLNPALRLA